MRTSPLILALLLPAAALADCPGGEEIFSCTIGKNALQVCHQNNALTYSFGPKGIPDLTLTEPLETADFTPWPGIGRTMWDSLAFHNEGITYEVWAALDKQVDETAPEPQVQGGVTVMKGDRTLASLTCNEGSVRSFLDTVSVLKTAIGQCWSFDSHSWTTGCN